MKKFERVIHYLRVTLTGNRVEVTARPRRRHDDRDHGVDRWPAADRVRRAEGERYRRPAAVHDCRWRREATEDRGSQ